MSKNPYTFLYYYIYRSIKKSGSNTITASTILLFSTLQGFNIIVILKLFKFLEFFNHALIVILFITIIILNVSLTYRKDGLNKIMEIFEGYPEEQHKKNWNLTLGYMIGSILMVIIVGAVTA